MTKIAGTKPTIPGSHALRLIPISKPGVTGLSYAVVSTDDQEVTVRKNAASQGLLAGAAMPSQPNPEFWSFIDYLKKL
jgi:hypothetical protein